MPADRTHSKTPFSILASFSLVTVLGSLPWIAYAQGGGDVFSSDSGHGKTWWDVKRRDYPECKGLVNRHEEMTGELYRLDAEAKKAVEPQRKQIVQQINDLSRQRTGVQKQIFECIRATTPTERGSPPLLQGTVEKGDPDPRGPGETERKRPAIKQKPPPPTHQDSPPGNEPSPTKHVQPPGFQHEPEPPEYGLFGKGQPDPIVMFADGTSKGLADCFEEDVKPENMLMGALLGKLKKFERIGKAVSTFGKANNLASIYEQVRQFNPNMTDYQLGRYLARLVCEGRDLADIGGGHRRNTHGPDPEKPDHSPGIEGSHKKPPDNARTPGKTKAHFPPAPPPLKRGMPLEDHKQLVKLAAAENKIILVRDSNPWAMRWVGRSRHLPKPQDVKAKTIQYDPDKTAEENAFAGLASAKGISDADRRSLLQRGYTIRGDQEIIVDPKGNRLYSDTDLHGVYEPTGQNAWSDSMKQKMNDAFLENMVQHGPQDNWLDRNNLDVAGPNAGPRPPVTAYLPDGTTQHLETIPQMKQFYEANGMDWDSLYPKF
jgi:hypothetical protein